MAIRDELKAQILRFHFAEHWRVGTIARQLGVHHSTVERVLSEAGVECERRRPRRPSMLDPYLGFITETLEHFPTLTAARLFDMVKARGYRGGPDHFRHRIAELCPRRPREGYLRLRTLPGEQAQVDWAHNGQAHRRTRRAPPDGVCPGAQLLAPSLRSVLPQRLARQPDPTDEHDVGGLLDEAQPEQVLDLELIDFFRPDPVERFEGFLHRESSEPDPAFDRAVSSPIGFALDELFEDAEVVPLLCGRALDGVGVMLAEERELELVELGVEGIEVWLSLSACHRGSLRTGRTARGRVRGVRGRAGRHAGSDAAPRAREGFAPAPRAGG